MKPDNTPEPIPDGHAFTETRDHFPADRLLRLHGFRIRSRPRGGESLWERGGGIYLESAALDLIGVVAA